MVTTTQLCLIIGGQSLPAILAAVDMHLRTNRLIAKIDRMCAKPLGTQRIYLGGPIVGSVAEKSDVQCKWEDDRGQVGDYRRQREEERLIFEERIRKTYRPRGCK